MAQTFYIESKQIQCPEFAFFPADMALNPKPEIWGYSLAHYRKVKKTPGIDFRYPAGSNENSVLETFLHLQ